MHLSITMELYEEKSQQIGSRGTMITKISDTNDRLILNINIWNQPATGHRNDYGCFTSLIRAHKLQHRAISTQLHSFGTGLTQSMRWAECGSICSSLFKYTLPRYRRWIWTLCYEDLHLKDQKCADLHCRSFKRQCHST